MPIRQQIAQSFQEKNRTLDFWVHFLIFACLGLAFWPLTKWFVTTANEQSRILHAFMVLVTATVFLIRYGGVEIRDPLTLNPSSRRALTLTYITLFTSFVLGQFTSALPESSQTYVSFGITVMTITAYCSGIASGVLFLFGEGTRRVTHTVTATFGGFIFLSTFMSALDWPLRTLAGKWSGILLNLVGKTVELGLVGKETAPPKLILLVDQYPFHVASECNGFGVIITSLLIAFLLGLYRRLNPFDLILNIAGGIIIGFIFNTVRIVIIVLLAPSMMNRYDLMHEIVGGITFWSCLVLAWLLFNGPIRDEPR